MLLTRNWLNKHLNLTKVTNEEISTALNSLGFEVDYELNYAELNTNMVIGYVQEHKLIEGTHLSVNQVKISKMKTVQIVCGASNVKQGQYVLVAPVGSQIANGLTMSKKMIQGYESYGMICALNEIGFNANQLTAKELDEIYVVKNYPVKKLETLIGHTTNVLGFDDYSWDVDLTLNRSDALSALQLAKELANYFKVDFKHSLTTKRAENLTIKTPVKLKVNSKLSNSVKTIAYSYFSLTNNDFELMTTDDLWLKMSGAKTTDLPLYDLANKVAIETGQPVIFLDADKAASLELTMKTVGDKDVIVLKQNDQLVNIIGQIPEPEFQVSSTTQKVLVLYLNFDQTVMRKQQQALNISNISLQRYMKPIYANKAKLTNQSLEKILLNYGILKGISSEKYLVGPVKINNVIKTNLTYINDFLGTNLEMKTVLDLFKHLDFKVTKKGNDLIFTVDPNRIDLVNPIDLTEEVARIYGYDNIPTTPLVIQANNQETNLPKQLQSKLSNYLIGLGFMNIKTYSLVSEQANEQWNLFDLKHPVKLLSPLSNQHEQYRLSLASSMLETIEMNLAKGNKQLKFFEFGDVYYDKRKKASHLMLGMNGGFDYYNLKGYVDAIFDLYNLDLKLVEFNQDKDVDEQIHPYINAKIVFKKKTLGFIYKLNPAYENSHKIGPTFLAELNLDALIQVANLKITSQEFSKFQASSRDLSVELSNTTSYQEFLVGITKNVDHLVSYELVDLYQDEELKAKKTLAITVSFTFNNLEEQMSETEINESWTQVLKNAKTLGVKVR